MTRRTRDNMTEVWWMGYKVARNPIGTVTNAPLASALGKESFQLQMGLSFPFLRANYLRSSLLIMRTRSFLLSFT